jgi:hypothetical protein
LERRADVLRLIASLSNAGSTGGSNNMNLTRTLHAAGVRVQFIDPAQVDRDIVSMCNMAATSPRRREGWTEREQIAPILHASTRRVRVSFRIVSPNVPPLHWRKGL